MTCSGSFATSYFFWAILSGLFVGFGLGRLLRFPARSDVDARHWKWIMFSLYMSAGVVLALCAAFIPSSFCSTPRRLRVSPEFLDMRILATAGSAAIAGLLGLRFKRIVGLPFLFLAIIGISAIPVLRHPWQRLDPGEPVAELRVLSVANGKRSIEFTPLGGDTYFVEVPGNGISVEASALRTSEYYFFIDRPMMYRLKSIGPAGNGETRHHIAGQDGDAAGRLQRWLQGNMMGLPGWEVDSMYVEAKLLLPLFRYSVFLADDDGPGIRLVQPQR